MLKKIIVPVDGSENSMRAVEVEKLGGYTKVKYTPLAGSDPADTIIEAAEEQGADTIVIGNRGLGTLSALILGSVSEKLIQSSRVPVLVVK